MEADKREAFKAGLTEAGIEVVKAVPGLAIIIEGFRAYHRSFDEKRLKDLMDRLGQHLEELSGKKEWFRTPAGIESVQKIVARAFDEEYEDRLEHLVNELVNEDQAMLDTPALVLIPQGELYVVSRGRWQQLGGEDLREAASLGVLHREVSRNELPVPAVSKNYRS